MITGDGVGESRRCGMVGGAALSKRYLQISFGKIEFLNILANNSLCRPNIKRSRCRQITAFVGQTSREAGVGK